MKDEKIWQVLQNGSEKQGAITTIIDGLMLISNNLEQNIDLMGRVLDSPAYLERCNALFEIFQATRQWNGDPKMLLEIQEFLAKYLIEWQEKKRAFKKEKNQLGEAILSCLNSIIRRIIDSLAWRTLGHDRLLIQILAEHPQTGYVDNSIIKDFKIAKEVVDREGWLVLINDLTNVLRYSDLTIVDPQKGIAFYESKTGESSSRNSRATRQKKRLQELIKFLETGHRINKDNTKDYFLRVENPIKTYHSSVVEVIIQARQNGYATKVINDCFAVEAAYLDHPNDYKGLAQPFDNEAYIISLSNLDVFDQPPINIAPYGIFPFDDKICFDLMTGNLFLKTTLNFRTLKELYLQHGLILQLPHPSFSFISEYLSASLEQRKRMEKASHHSWFTVGRGEYFMRLPPDHWGMALLEFITVETIVETNLDILNQALRLGIVDNEKIRTYFGYKNEGSVWI